MPKSLLLLNDRKGREREIKILIAALKNLSQLGNDGIADLLGTGGAAEVLSPDPAVEDVLDRRLDGHGLLRELERVPAHHGDGEDGADWVDDTLA